MFRKTVWRNTVSDAVSFHQDQALNTTIFLLKEYGPTGFLLKEEEETKKFKVCLGDPHTCTCPVFHREKDLCKHICWDRNLFSNNEEQQGLVERQILEVLHGLGLHQSRTGQTESSLCPASESPEADLGQADGSVRQREIQAQDACPICQEELLEKQLPVSYCRFGCGNNVHISCMKVWADHQGSSDGECMVKCPLCRENFCSLKLLGEQVKNGAKLYTAAERERPDRHLGVVCSNCRVCPVTGKCFKCTVCSYYYLCEDCSRRPCHPQHQFASRMRRRQRWLCVGERPIRAPGEQMEPTSQSENDRVVSAVEDPLPEHALECLPAVRVRRGSRLRDPGQQCRVCFRSFCLGQWVRTLPCHHKFHTDCIDAVLRKSNSCPLDGYVIYNPLTWATAGRKNIPKSASCSSYDHTKLTEKNWTDLFIPGVPLLDKTAKTAPSRGTLSSEVPTGPLTLATVPRELMIKSLPGLGIDTVTKEGKGDVEEDGTLGKAGVRKGSCSFERLSQYASSHRRSTHARSSNKTLAQHKAASTQRLPAVAEVSEQTQVGLFVGSRGPGQTASDVSKAAVPIWHARLQRKRAVVTGPRHQYTTDKDTAELRMTGLLINPQHQKRKES